MPCIFTCPSICSGPSCRYEPLPAVTVPSFRGGSGVCARIGRDTKRTKIANWAQELATIARKSKRSAVSKPNVFRIFLARFGLARHSSRILRVC